MGRHNRKKHTSDKTDWAEVPKRLLPLVRVAAELLLRVVVRYMFEHWW